MAADVDLYGAVEGTNPALHTTGRVRDNKTRHKCLAAGGITLKDFTEVHILKAV
jgi:hypothetical protein